jgi:hypothetical protein
MAQTIPPIWPGMAPEVFRDRRVIAAIACRRTSRRSD